MLFIRSVTIFGGGKLDIEVASMATVPGTESNVWEDFETDSSGLRGDDNVERGVFEGIEFAR